MATLPGYSTYLLTVKQLPELDQTALERHFGRYHRGSLLSPRASLQHGTEGKPDITVDYKRPQPDRTGTAFHSEVSAWRFKTASTQHQPGRTATSLGFLSAISVSARVETQLSAVTAPPSPVNKQTSSPATCSCYASEPESEVGRYVHKRPLGQSGWPISASVTGLPQWKMGQLLTAAGALPMISVPRPSGLGRLCQRGSGIASPRH